MYPDPETDVADYLAVTHRGTVLRMLKEHRAGLTDYEISDLTGLYLSSVNPSRGGLVREGLVTWTGEKRPSGRGGKAKVWKVITPDDVVYPPITRPRTENHPGFSFLGYAYGVFNADGSINRLILKETP